MVVTLNLLCSSSNNVVWFGASQPDQNFLIFKGRCSASILHFDINLESAGADVFLIVK